MKAPKESKESKEPKESKESKEPKEPKEFKPEELNEWYTDFFDPEGKEIKLILETTKLEGKKVAEMGCGTGRVSFKLIPYAKSYVALDKSRELIGYCNKKLEEIKKGGKGSEGEKFSGARFVALKGEDISSLKEGFDVIISTWAGMHYSHDRRKLLRGLCESLNPKGIFLLIESDQSSDFVKALNKVAPLEEEMQGEWDLLLEEFKEMLEERFRVEERILETEYVLPSMNALKKKFLYEIEYEEGSKFTEEMKQEIEEMFSGKEDKKGRIVLKDKGVFFVCRKKA